MGGRAAIRPRGGAPHTDSFFLRTLRGHRDRTYRALRALIPDAGPSYLYDLVRVYPDRPGKGLRAALCLATCSALGGKSDRALNCAVAVELFHNGFLVHDDVQDESEFRRGGAALHRTHGIGIAVNVGNATNLLAMGRTMENRSILGAQVSWSIALETQRMMEQTLEGQAIELAWIRDNVCRLGSADYLRMCLKKTSWYSFIYPMRVAATVAEGARQGPERFCRFGWYLGAAFQIQDDILNLVGKYGPYGKEIGGDLLEGKRTLMLIHLLRACTAKEHRMLKGFLARPRAERRDEDVELVLALMVRYGSIEFARRAARQLAGAALLEALTLFSRVPDSKHKRFILDLVLYVVDRDR